MYGCFSYLCLFCFASWKQNLHDGAKLRQKSVSTFEDTPTQLQAVWNKTKRGNNGTNLVTNWLNSIYLCSNESPFLMYWCEKYSCACVICHGLSFVCTMPKQFHHNPYLVFAFAQKRSKWHPPHHQFVNAVAVLKAQKFRFDVAWLKGLQCRENRENIPTTVSLFQQPVIALRSFDDFPKPHSDILGMCSHAKLTPHQKPWGHYIRPMTPVSACANHIVKERTFATVVW